MSKGEKRVRLILFAVSAAHAAVGLWMLLGAGGFYDALGPYQPKNAHFIREIAAFPLALAIVTLVAVRKPQWRIPVLWFATAQYAFLTVAAVVDIDETDPGWVGYFNAIVEALLSGAFAWFAGYVKGVQTAGPAAAEQEPSATKRETRGEDFSWEEKRDRESEPPPN